MRQQPVLEILRRHHSRGHDGLPEPGQDRPLQLGRDRLPVAARRRWPSPSTAGQMRHRRQHVERVAARRRQARIGRRRPVQIEAEILGQRVVVEDVVAAARDSAGPAGSCGAPRPRSAGWCRNTRRTGSSNTAPARSACRSSACGAAGRSACGRSRRHRRWTRRDRRGCVSPEARRTPAAAPRSTRISATSAPQRIAPPWPRISPARPCTSRPVPPMAKCTPQRRSRKAIRL